MRKRKQKSKSIPDDYTFPAMEVNRFAREKMKEKLLKDILFDLQVCELEGWSKSEYINEIKNIINSIKI